MANFCTNCGAPLGEGNFCTQCGAPIPREPDLSGFGVEETQVMAPTGSTPETATAPTAPVAPAGFQQTVVQQPVYSQPAANPVQQASPYYAQQSVPAPAQKKGLGAGGIVGIVGACVAVLALGVLLAVTHPWAPNTGASSEPATAASSAPAVSSIDTSPQADASNSQADAPSTESSASSTPAASAPATQDYSAQQQEVREAAQAAGMQVFSGTVKLTTYPERAHEVAPSLKDFDSYNEPLVLLLLDQPTDIFANNGDGQGARTQRGESIALGYDAYKNYDGKHVTIAAYGHDLWWPSDVAGVLYSVSGPSTLLYADGEAPITDGSSFIPLTDYMIADSSIRKYTRGELAAYTDYELFIARNEIYARHGRGFKNAELQSYFGSKSWYRESVSADKFNDAVLNDIEKANAALMLEIEKSRNSPYV